MAQRTKTRDEIEIELDDLKEKMSMLLDYITNSRISKPEVDLNTIEAIFDDETNRIIAENVQSVLDEFTNEYSGTTNMYGYLTEFPQFGKFGKNKKIDIFSRLSDG